MRSKLPDAVVSALIFLKCNDMSCVWLACTSTSTKPNCLLSHCKHETISRVLISNLVSNVFVFGSKKTMYAWLGITVVYSQILRSYLRVMYSYSHLQLVYSKPWVALNGFLNDNSILTSTRPVNSANGNARPSTRPVLTGNGNRSPVNSGSGNRALPVRVVIYIKLMNGKQCSRSLVTSVIVRNAGCSGWKWFNRLLARRCMQTWPPVNAVGTYRLV